MESFVFFFLISPFNLIRCGGPTPPSDRLPNQARSSRRLGFLLVLSGLFAEKRTNGLAACCRWLYWQETRRVEDNVVMQTRFNPIVFHCSLAKQVSGKYEKRKSD